MDTSGIWSKQLTEQMLNVLTDQHKQHGQLDHSAVAQKLNDLCSLPVRLERDDVQQHLEALLKRFAEEKKVGRSTWDWMVPVQKLYDIVADQENRRTDVKVIRPNVIQSSKMVSQTQRQTIVNNPNAKVINENKPPVLKLYPKSTAKVSSPIGSNGQSSIITSNVIQSNKFAAQPLIAPGSKSPKKVDIKIGVKVGNEYTPQVKQVKPQQQQQVIVSAQQPLLPAGNQAMAIQTTSGVHIQHVQRLEPQFTRIISPFTTAQTQMTNATAKQAHQHQQTHQQAQPILFITKDRGEQFLIPIATAPQQQIQKFQVQPQTTKLIQPMTTSATAMPAVTTTQVKQSPVSSQQPKKNKPSIIQHQPKDTKQTIMKKTAVTQKPIPAATTTTQVVSVPAFNQSAKSSEMKKESKPEKSVIKEGKAVRLAQNLTVRQGKQRIMPIPHVEYLLEVYAEYLDKRMLESGRLSKGTFNEIAADMNAKFKVAYYERDQITSKLQNLKVQYKNRKITPETTEAQLQLQAKMKAILELEVTMRVQAESRAKNHDHDHSSKKRKVPKPVADPEPVPERPQRKSVVQLASDLQAETKKESHPVKTSVIMSTPEFKQRHKSSPSERPVSYNSEPVAKIPLPQSSSTSSPEIIKKETIRDPVIELVDKKSDSEKTPTKSEMPKRPQEKIRMNSFLMDEAVTTLLDMSKNANSMPERTERLKEKRSELEKLRALSFNVFKSLTEVLQKLDE